MSAQLWGLRKQRFCLACRALEKHCTNTEQRLDNKDLVCSFPTKKNLLCYRFNPLGIIPWKNRPSEVVIIGDSK